MRNRSGLKADMDLDVIRNYKTGVFHHLNPQYLSVPNFLNNSFIYSGSLPVIFLFIWPVKCLLLHYLLALFSISVRPLKGTLTVGKKGAGKGCRHP